MCPCKNLTAARKPSSLNVLRVSISCSNTHMTHHVHTNTGTDSQCSQLDCLATYWLRCSQVETLLMVISQIHLQLIVHTHTFTSCCELNNQRLQSLLELLGCLNESRSQRRFSERPLPTLSATSGNVSDIISLDSTLAVLVVLDSTLAVLAVLDSTLAVRDLSLGRDSRLDRGEVSCKRGPESALELRVC